MKPFKAISAWTGRRLDALVIFIFFFVMLSGCSGATGNVYASNPLERGLSYIAAAIVTHGVLQIIFRK